MEVVGARLVSYLVDGQCLLKAVDGYPRLMVCVAVIVIVRGHGTFHRSCFLEEPWNRIVPEVVACYSSHSSPLILLFSHPVAF